jgi:C1A family cysteine protease
VNEVQHQQTCGSCYTFSSAAAAESAFAIKTGVLYKISEQHLLDCDAFSQGCNGGQQIFAQHHLYYSGAIEQRLYPYIDRKAKCKEEHHPRVFKLDAPGYKKVAETKESFKAGIRSQVINLSFAVGDDFWFYEGGIYTGEQCAQTVNHAMVAVGYGRDESGIDYAIVKNSWGADWGEQGYARVLLDDTEYGVCGIYSDNTTITLGF